MIKKRKKLRISLLCLFLLLICFSIGAVYYVLQNTNSILPWQKKTVKEQLLKYEPTISNELNKYQLQSFTPLLLAIMYQESYGKGNDPMQSSESAGLKRNEIQDPENSIKQGVYHFYQMYKYGTKLQVDLDTIIQSYNMGPGYIDFVASHGGKHTEELAKEYSKMQVERSPSVYMCKGIKGSFRSPYCFGDFSYTKKVKDKIPFAQQVLQKK
ncbi:lysozyme family protein [Microbacteriaceae bacterium 4G12]